VCGLRASRYRLVLRGFVHPGSGLSLKWSRPHAEITPAGHQELTIYHDLRPRQAPTQQETTASRPHPVLLIAQTVTFILLTDRGVEPPSESN